MIRQHHLTDLDELLLTVRNKNSAVYIQEAIIAYRTGAYRAAITSTWVAVCYDVVSKLRELASQNDSNAVNFITEFDLQIQNQNIPKLQKLENDVLNTAKNDFEFISSHEYEDLDRLKKDRNLCAHPAHTGNELLFQPTPELVRSHIVHAILHLLQRQPVQGKSAIEQVLGEMESRAFPKTQNDVFNFLNERYLRHAKDAFIKNLLLVLLKKLLTDDTHHPEKIINSIQAIARAHSQIYSEVTQEKLGSLFNSLNDQNIGSIFFLFNADPETWNKLQSAQQIKVNGFIDSLKNTDGIDLIRKFRPFSCLDMSVLQTQLLDLFKNLSLSDQWQIIEENPHKLFADTAIDFYSSASSFRGAESLATNLLIPFANYLNPEQIKNALKITHENSQIACASGIPDLIADFFELTKQHLNETKQAWIEFIQLRLENKEPNEHYAYPKLQELLRSNGLTWADQRENIN